MIHVNVLGKINNFFLTNTSHLVHASLNLSAIRHFEHTSIAPKISSYIKNFPELQTLKIVDLFLADDEFVQLQDCSSLQNIDSYICHFITNRSLEVISTFPNLKNRRLN